MFIIPVGLFLALQKSRNVVHDRHPDCSVVPSGERIDVKMLPLSLHVKGPIYLTADFK
jgi:hypothetical protein